MPGETWWGLTFSQNFSSPAPIVWDRQCLEDSEKKDDSINYLNNYDGVYRIPPVTPDLLIIDIKVSTALTKVFQVISYIPIIPPLQ